MSKDLPAALAQAGLKLENDIFVFSKEAGELDLSKITKRWRLDERTNTIKSADDLARDVKNIIAKDQNLLRSLIVRVFPVGAEKDAVIKLFNETPEKFVALLESEDFFSIVSKIFVI